MVGWFLAGIGVGVSASVLLIALYIPGWLLLLKEAKFNQKVHESPLAASSLMGSSGKVTTTLSPNGEVLVNGEFWSGDLESGGGTSLEVGSDVVVVSVEGNRLKVRPPRSANEETDSN